MRITQDVLETATAELLGGNVTEFELERLHHLITVAQHATDILLNEIARRGQLTFMGNVPIVPYMSDYQVATILTREEP